MAHIKKIIEAAWQFYSYLFVPQAVTGGKAARLGKVATLKI